MNEDENTSTRERRVKQFHFPCFSWVQDSSTLQEEAHNFNTDRTYAQRHTDLKSLEAAVNGLLKQHTRLKHPYTSIKQQVTDTAL